MVEHVTPGTSNFAYYPNGDSHPSTSGHQKATTGFVPLLNYYYNLWKSGGSGGGDDSGANGDSSVCLSTTECSYKVAFRLPGTNDDGWGYGGGALAWYPSGDAAGADDGYPGSLFGAGLNVNNQISEISIPVPVVSASKNLSDLNTATTLQGFTDLKGPLSSILDTPPQYAGIAWLPAQSDLVSGKLYLAFGQHFQEFDSSHLWCDTNLSSPNIAGPWQFGGYANYVTNDYLFAIPESFASTHLDGRCLASGRHREGVWSGLGPALFAAAPWADGNPPDAGTSLSTVIPLLLYGNQIPGAPEIATDLSRQMTGYSEADYWSGGAWLEAGTKSAVAFIGTKATGNSWYGFANGVVWDYECTETGTCQDVPDWPYDNRGYWAEGYEAQIKLYNPADIAAVAQGSKQTWEPQPYATLSLTPYLFDANIDVTRYRRHLVGSMAFDDLNNLLYFFELLADEDKGLVHVFRIRSSGASNDGSESTGSSDDTESGDDAETIDDTGSEDDAAETTSGGGSGGDCFVGSVF